MTNDQLKKVLLILKSIAIFFTVIGLLLVIIGISSRVKLSSQVKNNEVRFTRLQTKTNQQASDINQLTKNMNQKMPAKKSGRLILNQHNEYSPQTDKDVTQLNKMVLDLYRVDSSDNLIKVKGRYQKIIRDDHFWNNYYIDANSDDTSNVTATPNQFVSADHIEIYQVGDQEYIVNVWLDTASSDLGKDYQQLNVKGSYNNWTQFRINESPSHMTD